jgi:hypothetical protein
VSVGSGDGTVTFLTISVEQLAMLTATGAMKSLISELNAVDDRDFT